jgi:hypothetical protein
MNTSIPVTIILANLLVPQTLSATEAWWPVNDSTILGAWQAVDYPHGHVFRLEIRGGVATLAIADKLSSSDLVFSSKSISVREGRVHFIGTDDSKGLSILVEGEGRADDCGVLKLSMKVREPRRLHAYWDGAVLEFIKECVRSATLGALLECETRAKTLIDGHKKPSGKQQPEGAARASPPTNKDAKAGAK